MKHRLLENTALALVVAAVAVPLASAAPYEGYKSSYPQLHQLTASSTSPYDGYKSSYPQLHQMLRASSTSPYDGYKSSYPQLHTALAQRVAAPLVRTADRGFVWRDAAIGAGTAAAAIFLLTACALAVSRRRVRLAL